MFAMYWQGSKLIAVAALATAMAASTAGAQQVTTDEHVAELIRAAAIRAGVPGQGGAPATLTPNAGAGRY